MEILRIIKTGFIMQTKTPKRLINKTTLYKKSKHTKTISISKLKKSTKDSVSTPLSIATAKEMRCTKAIFRAKCANLKFITNVSEDQKINLTSRSVHIVC